MTLRTLVVTAQGKDPAAGGAPRGARLAGFVAVGLAGLSLAAFAAVMFLGPSASVPRIDAAGPMIWVHAQPSAGLVTALERIGALIGAAGTMLALAAVKAGWRPSPAALWAGGLIAVTAFVFLPPAGSTDVLNYASYGRTASLGHSPYLMTPVQLRDTGDPVGRLTPVAWQDAPTIYGPVATLAQLAAAELGGDSMARIVFWIRLGNALAFAGTGAALFRLAGSDRARRIRVALVWAVNPLMAFWLVGSGHVDAYLALLTALALLAVRRAGVLGGLLAGAAAGAAIAVKLTYAIVACGLIWPARRSARTIVAGACSAAVIVGISYLWPGAASTATISRRLAAGARFIFYLPNSLAARPALLSALVLAATVIVAALLTRGLPPDNAQVPGVRLMLALTLASLVVLPVQTPWYDALIFALLALMPASGLDYLLVARCLFLTELVLPGAARDSGWASTLSAAGSHVGIFVLLIALVTQSLRGAWRSPKGAAAQPADAPVTA